MTPRSLRWQTRKSLGEGAQSYGSSTTRTLPAPDRPLLANELYLLALDVGCCADAVKGETWQTAVLRLELIADRAIALRERLLAEHPSPDQPASAEVAPLMLEVRHPLTQFGARAGDRILVSADPSCPIMLGRPLPPAFRELGLEVARARVRAVGVPARMATAALATLAETHARQPE